jgi:NAD(P)-dependent dehydrogenase (short-subunit alcohol dehydrogenase family)
LSERVAVAFLCYELTSDGRLDAGGKRGALIFTSATAATRGNKTTSVFASAKFALRALSQSLAKEFGKQNIHVCAGEVCVGSAGQANGLFKVSTAIIDGGILTDRSKGYKDAEWHANEDARLLPESIAKAGFSISFGALADTVIKQSYLYLAHQDRSSWTWELDRE